MNSIRMFSIPYNGIDVDEYLSVISPYAKHIDSIFLGLPSLRDTHPRFKNTARAEENTLEFLSTDIPYKRLLTLNQAHYWYADNQTYSFCEKEVFPVVDKYHIEGIIVSDYTMARYIHVNLPDVELQTSCNTFSYNIHSMRLWKEECDITVFNPPRDILRTPDLLKKMRAEGFKLKCIVNESCRYGCTQQMIHCFCGSYIHGQKQWKCCDLDNTGILKCNYVLPRWLKYLDPYVDIFKIVGRGATTKHLVSMLDAYINERDDICIDDFIYGGAFRGPHLNFPVNLIPDKLLTCECKECKNCRLCDKAIEKYNDTTISK